MWVQAEGCAAPHMLRAQGRVRCLTWAMQYLSQPLWLLFVRVTLVVRIADCGWRGMHRLHGALGGLVTLAFVPKRHVAGFQLTQEYAQLRLCAVWQEPWVGSPPKCQY